MGLSSAVQWWEEWQLRILLLGSLGFQCYLAFFASTRKYRIHPFYRSIIWLSYLGSDALAVYALATLFNRQKNLQHSSVSGSHALEVLWAPILLMHLGGQINISAYNIEDNELWKRHIATIVSQVIVALYVFCKTWSPSTDKRLLAAAILLFIIGAFKCLDKVLALRKASFNSIVSSFYPAPRSKTTSTEVELEQYIQEAKGLVNCNEDLPTDRLGKWNIKRELWLPDKLFVDFASAYTERLTKLKSFWLLDDETAYKALLQGLSETFDMIYSKFWAGENQNRHPDDIWYVWYVFMWILSLLTLLLPVVPIGLFHSSDKDAYRGSDILVTFLLLYITYLLEISSSLALIYFCFKWPEKVDQHNLIGFLATKRHGWLRSLLHQYFCLKPCHSSRGITDHVRHHVKEGWINYVFDAESYREFSDIRGHWTLECNGCEQVLGESLEKPFDESVLLWHVATDFCFHHSDTSSNIECASMCREISNYMIHLLSSNPEMLMPGSRSILFTSAYKELEAILQGDDLSLLDEKELTQKIAEKVQSEEGIVHDAWVLAQDLMQLDDEKKMWDVIRGVWTEMLCFSAGRCRGYLHAKSLGYGGEYLTFVSLVMSQGGMETYTERQQRVHLRLPREERVRIAKEKIREARRNQADAAAAAGASAGVEVVVSPS